MCTLLSPPPHLIRKQGFTLIELSIVLVVIGLLIGGVISGKELIRNAEIRSFYAEKERIVLSVNTFKEKYRCLPGDCPNAEEFFGTDPEGCDPNTPDKTPKTQTCNGNGDGKIYTPEQWRAWQQLAAAELWGGTFRGSSLSVGNGSDTTVFPPLSLSKNFAWFMMHGESFDDGFLANLFQNNILFILDYAGTANGIFTPSEMLAFDSKYDDGKPAYGKIQVMNDNYLINCTNPSTYPAPDAVYDTSFTEKNCNPVFDNLF